MIWPFKREPVLTMEEYAAQQPMPPCGDRKEHFSWKLQGFPCPVCAGNEARRKEQEAENRMAKKIAVEVAKILKDQS